ncbi:energy transducer TonB [Cyclobacterium qasimii]|uniref:TonB C-terminal domain-containing protein n=2 Tax=Cyclobacterium qasimii TaxID=1350429 RepID=A0A512C753_9BACT|nr:energy transducer TonB [Cyclobacterium qasimii]GEO20033.1 hypothetical protein CQA01_05670 [Cyclobacterium qasimii]
MHSNLIGEYFLGMAEIRNMNSDDKLFNKPTIKAIKKLKKWKPAIQNGKSVKVAFQQKVNY